MRLLIVDANGVGLDVAIRALADGHEVKHFIRPADPKLAGVGEGLVDRVADFRDFTKWADLVLYTDNSKYLVDLERMREEGVCVVGPTREHAAWELDRKVGMDVMREAGIKVAPLVEFSDYDRAIAFVKKEQRRFVSKTGGDDKSLSYCSKSPADMIYMLEKWKREAKHKEPFILQDFIEGCEMAVSGWFGPAGWTPGWEENWEFKKLMNGDLGVATGEQGTVMRFVKKSKLADKVLLPLTPQLKKMGYCGNVDVNCIIDDHGAPWPLEFTMRPGWPSTNIQAALYDKDFVEWLHDLATGEPNRLPMSLNTIAIGVVVAMPPYPKDPDPIEECQGVPIYGIDRHLWPHVHLAEIKLADCPGEKSCEKEQMLASAGNYLLIMTATDETVQGAREKVYGRLKKLSIPNSPMWRTDIGLKLSKQLPLLQNHGYAAGMIYSHPSS